MSTEELASYVCQSLADAGIEATLTGGTCVSIWSENRYVSNDLDFIEESGVSRNKLRDVMGNIGFVEKNRHFVHPDAQCIVEFPKPPLTVGNERVASVVERKNSTGTLRLLSPTDCVKDRLAAFYYWKDQQSLEQAIWVGEAQVIDLSEVQRWSRAEGEEAQFEVFRKRLKAAGKSGKRSKSR